MEKGKDMNAIMIMAHKNIRQVIRLINTIKNDKNMDIFVHIDSKCEEDLSMIKKMGGGEVFIS